MDARRGIFVAPFDELADIALLADLAAEAEERGWDGLFLWDHIVYRPPVRAVLDPWVALSAIACATRRLRLGPLVTPLHDGACTSWRARPSRWTSSAGAG